MGSVHSQLTGGKPKPEPQRDESREAPQRGCIDPPHHREPAGNGEPTDAIGVTRTVYVLVSLCILATPFVWVPLLRSRSHGDDSALGLAALFVWATGGCMFLYALFAKFEHKGGRKP